MTRTGLRPRRLWGVPMSDQLPVVVRVLRVVEETPLVRTVFFDHSFPLIPGQFVMVWIPGIDEIPMALSAPDAITVQEVGEATRVLCQVQPGDLMGIRGPFGNGFSVSGRIMAVSGGVGTAPLLPLARNHPGLTFLMGARTSADLLFTDHLRGCSDLRIATDDGSEGYHGYVAGLLRESDPGGFDVICVCGPELMMKAVLDLLAEKDMAHVGQFSLHRYMKCGVGLCGSCCTDPDGLCVCRDGPVFRGDLLLGSELGHHHRDGSGRWE